MCILYNESFQLVKVLTLWSWPWFSFCPLPFMKVLDIKTHSSICPSVCHKNFNLAHIFEVLMIEHWYLACIVTSPFYWYHAVTLTFDLSQGQICCRAGDHNSSNLLVTVTLVITKVDRPVIFHMCIPCDQTFTFTPYCFTCLWLIISLLSYFHILRKSNPPTLLHGFESNQMWSLDVHEWS